MNNIFYFTNFNSLDLMSKSIELFLNNNPNYHLIRVDTQNKIRYLAFKDKDNSFGWSISLKDALIFDQSSFQKIESLVCCDLNSIINDLDLDKLKNICQECDLPDSNKYLNIYIGPYVEAILSDIKLDIVKISKLKEISTRVKANKNIHIWIPEKFDSLINLDLKSFQEIKPIQILEDVDKFYSIFKSDIIIIEKNYLNHKIKWGIFNY